MFSNSLYLTSFSLYITTVKPPYNHRKPQNKMLTLTHTFTSTTHLLRPPQLHSPITLRSADLRRPDSPLHRFNPLRSFVVNREMRKQKSKRGFGPVCYSPPLTVANIQWIATISSVVLMLVKGTAIQKTFLVPYFALQAPASLTSWIRGEYGIWTAFLALLVRLFFYIPGELELPFITLLMVIVLPYQISNLRGRQEGIVLSLGIAAFLAFQHFTRVGGLKKAFDQGAIIATLAVLCVVIVPGLLLI